MVCVDGSRQFHYLCVSPESFVAREFPSPDVQTISFELLQLPFAKLALEVKHGSIECLCRVFAQVDVYGCVRQAIDIAIVG